MLKNIRPIVICIFLNNRKILATEGYDKIKKQRYYRPVGGGIEFGESSGEALKREVKEEIGTEIIDLKKIGVIESIFEYEGNNGHEIVVVYDAKFKDEDFYEKEEIIVIDDDEKSIATWIHIDEVVNGKVLLYPEGLINLIEK